MKARILLCAMSCFAALTILSACASEPDTQNSTQGTAMLADTYWKLGRVGEQVIVTPQGAREMHFVLQSENQRVVGFSGCNQMMGAFALNGSQLKFDQMASTKMACVGTSMQLEGEFLAIFPLVAKWEISGQTLRLLDEGGKTLATFEARQTRPQPPTNQPQSN
jgi:copper homeostasis protein (lipoprotein)/putative lipoprotein